MFSNNVVLVLVQELFCLISDLKIMSSSQYMYFLNKENYILLLRSKFYDVYITPKKGYKQSILTSPA